MDSHKNTSHEELDDDDDDPIPMDREDNESENIDESEAYAKMEILQESLSNGNANIENDDKSSNGEGGVPDKKRLDYLANMSKIEKEFSDLRDKLFEERLQT